MSSFYDTDELLRRALAPESPDPALLGRVKASMRKEQDMRTTIRTKRIVTLALAAALLLALGVTAYAALDAGDWFASWFADQTQQELTEGQKAYITQAAAGVGQSVTADGWTVTLDSAMTDGKYCYMKLDIQAPEGTEGALNPFPGGTLVSTDPDAPEDIFSGGGRGTPLDVKGEGSWQFVLEKSIPTDMEGEVDWSYPLTLTLNELVRGDTEHTLLSRGPWQFQFTLTPPERQEAELAAEPFTATGILRKEYYNGEPFDFSMLEPGQMVDSASGLEVVEEKVDVTVTSLKLTAMGAVITYEYEGEKAPTLDPWQLEITLSDGSAVEISGCRDAQGAAPDQVLTDIEFTEPIDLGEVTAASFQGHALALPEK